MGIGTNIKQLLKSQGKTIKWLSEASKIPVNTLYNITKRDEINVHPKNVEAIARSLNVSVDELIGDNNTLTIQPEKHAQETKTVTSDNTTTQAKTTTQPNFPPSDLLSRRDLWEFRISIRNRNFEIDQVRNHKQLSQEEKDHIIQRKLTEIELLKYFFLLNPQFKDLILYNAKQQLSFQESMEMSGYSSYLDIPMDENDQGEWTNQDNSTDSADNEITLNSTDEIVLDEDTLAEMAERGKKISQRIDNKLKLLDI